MDLSFKELSILESLEIKGGFSSPLDTNNGCSQDGCTQSSCTDNTSCPTNDVCPLNSKKCWINELLCPITPEQGKCPGSGISCPVQDGVCGN